MNEEQKYTANINSFDETSNLLPRPQHQHFQKDLYLDDIINKTPISNKYIIFISLYMSFMFITYGIELGLMNTIIIPVQKKFNLSNFLLETSISFIFLGICTGSSIAGILTEKMGRIFLINFLFIILSITHLIMSIFLYFTVFIVCRLVIGFCLGIILPISLNICGEYLSNKYRCLLLMCMWSFLEIGEIILNLFALAIIPNLEIKNLNDYLCLLLLFPIIATLSSISFLKDSPRNMILSNEKNINEVFEILNSMNGKELTEMEINCIIKETKILKKKISNTGSYKDMFNKKYINTSCLLISILFIYACDCYGIHIITSITLKNLEIKENQPLNKFHKKIFNNKIEKTNYDIIINQIIISVIGTILNAIGGLIGEIKNLGRKGAMIIFIILTAFCIIFIPIKLTYFEFFSPLSLGFAGIFGDIATDYSVELYPTSLRDISTSLLFMTYNISCFISQFIFIGLFNINYWFPFIFGTVITLIGVPLIYFLPYEVVGKSLDTFYDDNGNIFEEPNGLYYNKDDLINNENKKK